MFVSENRQQVQAFDRTAWNSHRHSRLGYNNRDRRGYPGDPGSYRFALYRTAPVEPQAGRTTPQCRAARSIGPRRYTRRPRSASPAQCHFPNRFGESSEKPHAAVA